MNDQSRAWDVEEILAEKTEFGEWENEETGEVEKGWIKHYLIKWIGWSMHYTTWEPKKNLVDGKEETLRQWQRQSMLLRREKDDVFDVQKWAEERKEYMRRKDVKRLRLGMAAIGGWDSQESESEYEEDASDSAVERARSRPSPALEGSSEDDKPLMNRARPDAHQAKRRRVSVQSVPSTKAKSQITRKEASKRRRVSNPGVPMARSAAAVATADVSRAGPIRHEPACGGSAITMRRTAPKASRIDIFGDWSAAKPRHRNYSMAGKAGRGYSTLQHQNRARKKERVDFAPPLLAEDGSSPPLQRSAKASSSSNALQQRNEQLVENAQDLLTCWYWANAKCIFGVNCALEHSHQGKKVAWEGNRLQKNEGTCYYWLTQHCNNTPESCAYSHNITPYLVPLSGRRITKTDLYQPPAAGSDHEKAVSATRAIPPSRSIVPRPQRTEQDLEPIPDVELAGYQDRPHPKEHLGCHFYNFGTCHKSADQCKFPHVKTRWVRSPNHSAARYNPSGRAFWQPWQRQVTASFGQGSSLEHARTLPIRAQSPQQRSDTPPPATKNPQAVLPFLSHPTHTAHDSSSELAIEQSSHDTMVTLSIREPPCKLEAAVKSLAKENVGLLERSTGELLLECMCSSDDAKATQMFDGYVALDDGDLTASDDYSARQLGKVADTLVAHSAAAVCFQVNFCAVIYPLKGDWSQILKPKSRAHPQALLRVQLLPPMASPCPQLETDNEKKAKHISRSQTAHDRRYEHPSFDSLFETSGGGKAASRVVFVIFQASFQDNFDALTNRFMSSNIRVYHSTVAGSWAFFHKVHGSSPAGGVILIHESFPVSHCKRLPYIQDFLSLGRFNFFRFSDEPSTQNAMATPESPSKEQLRVADHIPEFVRLFPGGQAVYLMDDCLEEQPHDLLPALRRLAYRARAAKTPTYILGRPGLIEWAAQLAGQEASRPDHEIMREDDKVHMAIYKLLLELTESETLCKVESLDADDIPDYTQRWEADNAETANFMVDWYARWGLQHAEGVRRFYVLSMMRSSLREEWKRKYAHLTVMTPQKWCDEEASKEDKKHRAERELRKSVSAMSPGESH